MDTALIVIDMQVGLFEGENPCHDAGGVVGRINALAQAVRDKGGIVVFVQHENDGGLAAGSRRWQLLPDLHCRPGDPRVAKRASDCFYRSTLDEALRQRKTKRLLITGCATEFCVDTTVRSAASKDYDVIAIADGHTTKDRPHATAATMIAHHNWIWSNLSLPQHPIRVMSAAEALAGL